MPVSAKHLRDKARERVRQHRAQRAEAGEQRLEIRLPADVVAALDATRGALTRSDVMLEALADWLHRRQPTPPAPALAPVPTPAGKKTRRPRRITT
jgi:hypothetical protein